MPCKVLHRNGSISLSMSLYAPNSSSGTALQYANDPSDNIRFPIDITQFPTGSRGDGFLVVSVNQRYDATGDYTGLVLSHTGTVNYDTGCTKYLEVDHYTGETFIQSDQLRYRISTYRSELFSLDDTEDAGGGGADTDGDGVLDEDEITVSPLLSGECGSFNTLELTWSVIVGATSYTLRRDGVIIYTGPLLTFLDTNTSFGVIYAYTISATGVGGEGPQSAPVNLTPCFDEDPGGGGGILDPPNLGSKWDRNCLSSGQFVRACNTEQAVFTRQELTT